MVKHTQTIRRQLALKGLKNGTIKQMSLLTLSCRTLLTMFMKGAIRSSSELCQIFTVDCFEQKNSILDMTGF